MKAYQKQTNQKKQLLILKNKYLAIIYSGCLKNKPVKKIHKELLTATINNKKVEPDKYLLGMMIKTSNKAKKLSAESTGLLALAIFDLFKKTNINDKAKKLINYDLRKKTEKEKDKIIDDFIEENRSNDKWFYLASSHNDCAEDHKDYQGKLYIDNKAPDDIKMYAMKHNIKTIQWVMDSPVWFITRPNCRHYFVALTEKQAKYKPLKRLTKKYKTHNKEGDRDFATPRTIAIEEYEDRLKMLKALYNEYPIDKIKKEILKTQMLLKKWRNSI